jgi:bifunctional non-homologous end joining protein LigD
MPYEAPKVTVEVDGRRMRLSSLEKVMYPRSGTTKAQVIDYYARIAPVILPHLRDRAVTRIRFPHGVGDMQFFEKNIPAGTPAWIRRAGRDPVFPFIDDLAGLTFFANLNSLELHVPQWRYEGEGRDAVPLDPDRLVIDLDPGPGTGLHECARVALVVRERLGGIGLDTVPVTSGSKGLQLYAVLPGTHTSDQIRDTVQQLAQELTKQHPELIVWKMAKELRPGKIFLDWSQNVAAKTTICPYSLRGRDRPTVAAPRSWAEIEAGASGDEELVQLTADEVLDRVDRDGDLAAEIAG